jgi:hypothetical protein
MMRSWKVDKDYFTISIAAIGWTCLICASFSLLTGCSRIEGDGFVNDSRVQGGVICNEIRPNFTKCEDMKG